MRYREFTIEAKKKNCGCGKDPCITYGEQKESKNKLSEQELTVVNADDKQVTLIDPKTKITTIVPKDPAKPGIIQTDPDDASGKGFKLDMKTTGAVAPKIAPGAKVKMNTGTGI